MPQSDWAAYLLLQAAALSVHLLCAYSNWLLMAGFSAMAIRGSRYLKAIHISDWMEQCHRSWQPLIAHLNFSVAAEPSCVPPHLRTTLFFFHRCCYENTFFFFYQSYYDVPSHMTVICNSTRLPPLLFLRWMRFSSCRHCRIWHLSLSGINYWFSALSLLFSWMLRILWYL